MSTTEGRLNRRGFLGLLVAGAGTALSGRAPAARTEAAAKPNVIIIFTDDQGYGDLGCFGAKDIKTPNIDRMAAEGMKFTSFYSAAPVCTPSRAALMTGCYPRRVNLHLSAKNQVVLYPAGARGLNPREITLAELLKSRRYATACIGKWHLGDQRPFLPTSQGFDSYFGIPYSNNMTPRWRLPPLPLMRNETVIEAPADQKTLTKRYTEEALKFITAHKDGPFFLYLPHTMPHTPLFVSDAFRGKSAAGRYGDAIEEIDWSTGQILQTLKTLGVDDRTLVVFTSDNGSYRKGSNTPLRGAKGSTWEGGMREPCVIRWPGKVPAGRTCDELATTMDLLPTIARLAGAPVPKDRIIDGKDIWPLMIGRAGAKTPHEVFYYYRAAVLQALRSGKWKLHLAVTERRTTRTLDPPELYDLENDLGETANITAKHPDVVKRLLALADRGRKDLRDGKTPGKNQRPAGSVANPKPQTLNPAPAK